MARKQEISRKAKVQAHLHSSALIDICNDKGAPITAGEFAKELGIARNTARKMVDLLVKAGYADSVKVKRGDIIMRLYCPVGFIIRVTESEAQSE